MGNRIATKGIISLISAMLLLCMVWSEILINSSMFHHFAFTFASLFLFASLIPVPEVRLFLDQTIIYIVIWGAYIIVHTLTIGEGEWYQSGSYVVGFVYMIALVNWLKNGSVTFKQLSILFSFFGVAQAVYCILQYLHICPPLSSLFPVSGSFENPNITAMYIVATLPFILFNTKKKVVLLGCAGLMFAALLVLKCRTAYLGLFPVLLIYLIHNTSVISRIRQLSKVAKGILLSSLILFFAIGSFYLYHAKKASADGRLFVWKVTTQMIADKPVVGYGYGLFAKHYNLHQATYFQEKRGSGIERKNARHVYTSYNEYLEQTAKGGVVGGAFFIVFLVLVAVKARRIKDRTSLAIITSIAVMGLTNFIQTAFPVWILLLTVSASVISREKKESRNFRLGTVLSRGLCVVALLLIGYHVSVFIAQRELKVCISSDARLASSCDRLGQHADAAGSSEIYLRMYARSLMQQKRYKEALSVLEKAEKYTSAPSLYSAKAACFQYLENIPDAIKSLETIYYMVPSDDDVRFRLMMLYKEIREMNKMEVVRREILLLENESASAKINHYKKIANSLERGAP